MEYGVRLPRASFYLTSDQQQYQKIHNKIYPLLIITALNV
ncbi:hypothetical protein RintRC_5476 [Richelia intracellularis]|nr:hypothetical protein RintRC_5476 [Richelia intracellularis]